MRAMSDFEKLKKIKVESIDDEEWDLSENYSDLPWPNDGEKVLSDEDRVKLYEDLPEGSGAEDFITYEDE